MEIALQPAFSQRHRQLVFRFGKMVHTDEHIAFFVQQLHRILQNVQFLFAGRHGIGIDTPLRFENVRQMRVMIQRDAVGIQRIQHCI